VATLVPQELSLAGVTPTLNAVSASDKFRNNGRVYLRVTNNSGGSINVTVDDPNSTTPPSATAFNPDVVVAVPNAASRVIGPFPPHRFNDANGEVTVNFSGTTSVTAELVQVGQ
jgi:hypothetical protein